MLPWAFVKRTLTGEERLEGPLEQVASGICGPLISPPHTMDTRTHGPASRCQIRQFN